MSASGLQSRFIHLRRRSHPTSIPRLLTLFGEKNKAQVVKGQGRHKSAVCQSPGAVVLSPSGSRQPCSCQALDPHVGGGITGSTGGPASHMSTGCRMMESDLQPGSPDSRQPCAFLCMTLHSRHFKHTVCLQESTSFGLGYSL